MKNPLFLLIINYNSFKFWRFWCNQGYKDSEFRICQIFADIIGEDFHFLFEIVTKYIYFFEESKNKTLPANIWDHVRGYLNLREIFAFKIVCKGFEDISNVPVSLNFTFRYDTPVKMPPEHTNFKLTNLAFDRSVLNTRQSKVPICFYFFIFGREK